MTVIARMPRGSFAYWEKRFASFPRRSDAVLPVHYLDCPDSGRILGFIRQPIQTLIIDLQQTPDAIMDGFRASTRNEIRRAERESVLCRAASSFDQFLALYEGMSRRQSLPPTPAAYLQSLGEHLCITEAVIDGNVVCCHLYVADRTVARARLIRSASLFRETGQEERKKIGRANRLLHFHDMLLFRQKGLGLYDLGGYYPETAPLNPELTRINEFKASFGGRLKSEANYLSCALYAYRASRELYRRARQR
jgi:hypothetical protein